MTVMLNTYQDGSIKNLQLYGTQSQEKAALRTLAVGSGFMAVLSTTLSVTFLGANTPNNNPLDYVPPLLLGSSAVGFGLLSTWIMEELEKKTPERVYK